MRRLSAPSRRWVVPAAVVVAVGAGAGSAVVSASAAPELPPRTAAQLLADLGSARVDGLSGTVVQHADLGLPELPTPGGGQGSSDLSSLISGSHTLRVWYAGKDKVRIALLGTLGESDVIRNGPDVWIWSSANNTVRHQVLPPLATAGHRSDDERPDPAGSMPLTPQQAAQRALDAVDPSTAVRVDGTAEVAGRSAYELVLAPRDTRALVNQIRIAVDADRHVPLRVQVIARGHTSPALEIGYTHISFTRPADQEFRFTPPPGARVVHPKPDTDAPQHSGRKPAEPTTVGTGWTRVAVIGVPSGAGAPRHGGPGAAELPGDLAPVLSAMPRVHGDWGSGRLLRSSLFTALLTDDGRLVVGMVGPDLIYQAAAHR